MNFPKGLYLVCPQCGTAVADTDWRETINNNKPALLHSCGYVTGNVPEGHPQVGDEVGFGPGYTKFNGQLIDIHPDTIMRLVVAHNAVTGTCGGYGDSLTPNGEQFQYKGVLHYCQFRKCDLKMQLWREDYAYAICRVVKLPEDWRPIVMERYSEPNAIKQVASEIAIV